MQSHILMRHRKLDGDLYREKRPGKRSRPRSKPFRLYLFALVVPHMRDPGKTFIAPALAVY
jgi:hypothetical protein